MQKNKAVCITGMPRSGTSMISRILNIIGVYLGKQDSLLMEAEHNVRGCWEHKTLGNISNEALARLEYWKSEAQVLPTGWEKDPKLQDLEAQARSLIENDFGGHSLWGWKDTLCCITLPFWQNLIPDMDYVICVRNPIDVAQSVISSNKKSSFGSTATRKWASSLSKLTSVWFDYTSQAVSHTSGKHRIFVFYEDMMGPEWRNEVRRLASFLGVVDQEKLASIEAEASKFISHDLQHHGTPFTDTLENSEIPFEVKSFYFILRQFAKEEDGLLEGVSCKPSKVLDELAKSSYDTMAIIKQNAVIKGLERKVEEKQIELADKIKQIEEKNRQIELLLNSASWKITAPLRRALEVIQKS